MRVKLAGLAVLMLAGCASGNVPEAADPVIASPSQIAAGRVMAERRCGACHSIGKTDHSAVAAAPAFRDLGKRYPVSDLAETLAEGIVTGHPSMPEWVFDPEEITQLLGYIESIQARPPAT